MTKAIVVRATGGPEVLEYTDVDVPAPGPGEIRMAHHAIGLNYLDVYQRSGFYPAKQIPFTPGNEGAGVITAVGEGVSGFSVGDRVAYANPLGGYAEERVIAADRVVKVPDGVDLDIAGSMMLKGMTAEFLLCRTFPVNSNHTILFHAAAGGVGLMAGQWAKSLGATVIGTAGSQEKIDLALQNGYDHVINYRTEDFVERVHELTDGKGVDVAYDSVGKDIFLKTFDCIRPLGMLVSFGQSSGPIEPLPLGLLSQKGSLYVTRPTLFTYVASRADLEMSAGRLFEMVASGKVKVSINQTYPLSEAARAHADLEGRKTTGTTILKP